MSEQLHSVIVKSEREPFLIQRSEGYFEYQLPISVKGIVTSGNAVLLVGNSRGELELPGGKLEIGESPVRCVEREISEETGLPSKAERLVHAWVYNITPVRHVFVIAYGMSVDRTVAESGLTASEEVGRALWVPLESLRAINMPDEYRTAIAAWLQERPDAT
jgi:8-oxo-dGTP pyrophosphatase MutT (NUDIX family)